MSVRIVIIRHGERMDRFVEAQGKDWLSSALVRKTLPCPRLVSTRSYK